MKRHTFRVFEEVDKSEFIRTKFTPNGRYEKTYYYVAKRQHLAPLFSRLYRQKFLARTLRDFSWMLGSPLICIIDDEDKLREVLKGLVRSFGYAAETFASAEEFLESHHLVDTHCLILDVQLQGMNGLELQRRLSADGYNIPTVFISAHTDNNARMQAIEAGAVDFLYKPFSEDALLTAVQSAFQR